MHRSSEYLNSLRRHKVRRAASCLAAALLLALVMPLANRGNATTIYWDGTGNNIAGWSNAAFWSTSSSATTPNPSAAPGANDIAVFNISSVNSAQTVQLDVGAGVAALG